MKLLFRRLLPGVASTWAHVGDGWGPNQITAGAVLGHFWSQVRSKLGQVGPKLVSESMLEGSRGALGGAQTSKIDFNSLVAANMGPSWGQAGAKLAPASDQ